jgi:hypothetical protein
MLNIDVSYSEATLNYSVTERRDRFQNYGSSGRGAEAGRSTVWIFRMH